MSSSYETPHSLSITTSPSTVVAAGEWIFHFGMKQQRLHFVDKDKDSSILGKEQEIKIAPF